MANSTPILFRILNPIMVAMLRSPLHRAVSKSIMLLTFTGRKSGRRYTTPVSYFQENGTVYCFTHSTWWKNLVGGREVVVHIRGQGYHGIAKPTPDDVERIVKQLGRFFEHVPGDARFYNITLDEAGKPDSEELLRAAEEATMIEIKLRD